MNDVKESPLEKKTKVLDYFLEHKDEIVRPSDIRKHYKIASNEYRTLVRNCQFFHLSGIIESVDGLEPKNYDEGTYDTHYRLTTHPKVNFNIPKYKTQRFNYATLITSVLMGSGVNVTNPLVLPLLTANIYQMLTMLGVGIIRETLLASKIYDSFKHSKEGLLGILIELAYLEQPIHIEISRKDNVSLFNDVVIEHISIESDGSFALTINNELILLESLDQISNIFIVSNSYPHSSVGFPSLNKKTFIETVKSHPNYGRMKEGFAEEIAEFKLDSDDEIDEEFDNYIENLVRDSVDGLSTVERANRRIKRPS